MPHADKAGRLLTMGIQYSSSAVSHVQAMPHQRQVVS